MIVYKEQIKQLKKMVKFEEKIAGKFDDFEVSYNDYVIAVYVSDLVSLKKVRSILRSIFGKWNDKKGTMWGSNSKALVNYVNKMIPEIEIYFKNSPEEMNKIFGKEKCKFKIKETVIGECDYVCEVKQ